MSDIPSTSTKISMTDRIALLWAAVVVVLCAVMVWAAVQADDPLAELIHTDKMRHVMAFGAVGLCAALMPGARLRLVALGGVIGFGIALELIQIPVPDRNGSLADFLASCIGAFGGFGLGSAATMAWDIVRGPSHRPGPPRKL